MGCCGSGRARETPMIRPAPAMHSKARFGLVAKCQCNRPKASHAEPLDAQKLLAIAVPTVPES